MFAYIIIYRNAIGHIFAKPTAKCLTLLRVKELYSALMLVHVVVKREVLFD